MKGIDLRGPTKNSDNNLFPVHDDVILMNPPIGGTIISFVGESIVPIVANVHGQSALRCLGTGFFVSCSGLLVTAAHVITDPIERRYGNVKELDDMTLFGRQLHLGVMVPNNPLFQRHGYKFYPFEWCMILANKNTSPLVHANFDIKLSSDIAICKVVQRQAGSVHQPLTINQTNVIGTGMTIGCSVFTIGYYGMKDVELSVNDRGELTGDCVFHLYVSTGRMIDKFPDNLERKEVPTPGPCFSFAAKIPGGMSGGPIFDQEGIYVHGIVSKSWQDETGLSDFSFGSMLTPSTALPISRNGWG
jgi:Trypsin-like peptidase domain